jgi:hypothetical protein
VVPNTVAWTWGTAFIVDSTGAFDLVGLFVLFLGVSLPSLFLVAIAGYGVERAGGRGQN